MNPEPTGDGALVRLPLGSGSRFQRVRNDSLFLQRESARMARCDLIAVYLMASRRNGTLYLCVTSDLVSRAQQHRDGDFAGFSARYGCRTLVWYEAYADISEAIAREKSIKKWRRPWKLALIEKDNPSWRDLYEDFLRPPPASFLRND